MSFFLLYKVELKPLFNAPSVMFASIFTFRSVIYRSFTDDGTSTQAKPPSRHPW